MDWDAWLRLAALPGAFTLVSVASSSMGYHEDSETTAALAGRRRQDEDRRIFDALWPRPVAALLARLYARAYTSNR